MEIRRASPPCGGEFEHRLVVGDECGFDIWADDILSPDS
jgi:hypothetical protein